MSEVERARRMSVQGRLADLRAKYGSELESQPMPEYLESLEGALRCWRPVEETEAHAPVRRSTPAANGRVAEGGHDQPVVDRPPVVQSLRADFSDLDV